MNAKINRMPKRRQKIAIVRHNLNRIRERLENALRDAFVGKVLNLETTCEVVTQAMLAELETYAYVPGMVSVDPDDSNKIIVEMPPAVGWMRVSLND